MEFIYHQEKLKEKAQQIINQIMKQGASSAQVELNESYSKEINILQHKIENFTTSYDSQVVINLYFGNKKAQVGFSNIENKNLDLVIKEAFEIAKYSEEDPYNSLLEAKYLVNTFEEDLSLFNPIKLNNQELITSCLELENMALKHPDIHSSDGSSLNLLNSNFVLVNTNGLNAGYQTTRYSKSLSLIGKNQYGMQGDYWYSSTRDFNQLLSSERLANTVIDRVVKRLKRSNSKLKTNLPAVILESSIASGFINSLCQALSGAKLYRKLSFLNNSLNKQILPAWFNLNDNPFINKGLASCYFDNEGALVTKRNIITNGVVNNYFLSSYSARKMKMEPTGNAGGPHNLLVASNFAGDLFDLTKLINDGIIIIDTIGSGLNMVTGDYSVGASGLIVKDGEIDGFIDNLTIAGNMLNIFNNITHIANDPIELSSIQCGSMLISPGVIQVEAKH